jgi:peptide chain release factor 1
MNPSLIRKLEGLIERHEEVQALLGEPGVASDQDRYRALTREYAQLEDIVHAFQRFRQAEENLDTTQLSYRPIPCSPLFSAGHLACSNNR